MAGSSRSKSSPGAMGITSPSAPALPPISAQCRAGRRTRDSAFDYGVILLPADNRLGDQLGWFGYQVHTDDELSSYTVNISGYPGAKLTGTQWWMSGTVKTVNDRTFVYNIDTAGGQSGAPVWIVIDGDNGRYGVGVHTNGAQSGNSATRIIQQVFDNVTTWRNEAP